jgi:type I restriction enzyme M protein
MSEKLTQDQINNILWQACDTFRGKIDSSIYKDYILVTLFIKYLSDTYKEHYDEYAKRYDGNEERIKRALSRERFVLDENSTFDYLYDNRNDTEKGIGQLINTSLENIEENNKGKLRGVFRNIDFNSEVILGKTKERNAMLKHLLEDFTKLDLRPSNLEGNDVIGDAYEYLISRFASDAGKKGGEFFTPSMVSELISRLVKPEENDRIYDPTCGSGSLLIRTFKKVPNGKAQVYGQERNGQTQSLCRMNMFLHGIDDARIAWGDTLANPLHLKDDKLMKFQVVIANPPFSLDKWAMGFSSEETVDKKSKKDKKFKMDKSLDPYRRFEWGVPPSSKGDFAFVQHMLYSLDSEGKMAVVLPHGVLFRGASEGKIRQQIIDMNLLDAVIGLPENLFFGTGIPACILVFKKNRPRKDVLFVDASGEGNYEKGKNQNFLREEDLIKIVETYDDYETIDKYSYVATIEEIKENDYNLNIPRYVDTFEEEEPVDMDAVKENIINIKAELRDVEAQMAKYLEELGL